MLCEDDHRPCTCSHNKPPMSQDTKDTNLALSLFLDAVRDILVDEICAASRANGHLPAVKLQSGFCLLSSRTPIEWTRNWEADNDVGTIYCEMQLHLMATHILIQPVPRRLITLTPLREASLGAAILLLPQGIPAFCIGQQGADDRVVCEFLDSLGQKDNQVMITNDFIRCYIPVRNISHQQDGGITTIWPRDLVLATPLRPPLPTLPHTNVPIQKPPSTPPRFQPNDHLALVLTSLSLHSSVDMSTLSTAMGAYVESIMKERDKPRVDPARLHPPNAQAEGLAANPSNDPLLETARPSHTMALSLSSGPAESYPSPLEMLVDRVQSSILPELDLSSTHTDTDQHLSSSAALETNYEPPRTSEDIPSSTNPFTMPQTLESWDPSGVTAPFDFGGAVTTSYDPFASGTMFTEADFNIFSSQLPETSTTDIVDSVGNIVSSALGEDVLMALSDQPQPEDFAKLDASLIDWNFAQDTVPFAMPAVEEIPSGLATTAQMFQTNLEIEPFGVDLPMITPSKTPGALEAPNSSHSIKFQLSLDSPAPFTGEKDYEVDEDAGFLAVQFSKANNIADEKYSSGKYSLPSPPPDTNDSRSPIPKSTNPHARQKKTLNALDDAGRPWKSSTTREGDLRARYMAATQPKQAMLAKLSGTKRPWSQNPAVELGFETNSTQSPLKKRRLTWGTGNEAWRHPTPPEDYLDSRDDGDSSLDGDEFGADDGQDDPFQTGDPLAPVLDLKSDAHVCTQDPVKLLQASFNCGWLADHNFVLSSDLILPTSKLSIFSNAHTPSFTMPISVPTPVSPDAINSHSEPSSKLTTNIARHFAKEAGNNTLWYSTSIAMAALTLEPSNDRIAICQAETVGLAEVLKAASNLSWGKSIAEIAEADYVTTTTETASQMDVDANAPSVNHVMRLYTPKLLVGHGTGVIEALPAILRFWDHINMVPLNGPKDVNAVAFVSDAGGPGLVSLTDSWLKQLSKIYGARRLGTHAPMSFSKHPNGVIPIQWDDFRTICGRFLAAKLVTPLVVYVVVPNSFANLQHPSALAVLGVMAEVTDSLAHEPRRLLFRLIPEVFVSHQKTLARNLNFSLDKVALAVYDAIPRVIERQHSRISSKLYASRDKLDAYAFTLGARKQIKATLVERWPPPAADVFDRYTFMHVAYASSVDGEWLTASVVTERGDMQENAVWKLDDVDPFTSIARLVLDFTLSTAKQADIDWRVTIGKSDAMSAPELDAWKLEFDSRFGQGGQSMHITLLSVTKDDSPTMLDSPLIVHLPNQVSPPSRDKEGSVFLDISTDAFILFPRPTHLTVSTHSQVTRSDFLTMEHGAEEDTPSFMIPVSTCWLVHILRQPGWTTHPQDSTLSDVGGYRTSSLQIHALHLVRYGNSSYSGEARGHMRDVATNFYDLTILNDARRGDISHGYKQPLHFAVAEAMASTLSGIQI